MSDFGQQYSYLFSFPKSVLISLPKNTSRLRFSPYLHTLGRRSFVIWQQGTVGEDCTVNGKCEHRWLACPGICYTFMLHFETCITRLTPWWCRSSPPQHGGCLHWCLYWGVGGNLRVRPPVSPAHSYTLTGGFSYSSEALRWHFVCQNFSSVLLPSL